MSLLMYNDNGVGTILVLEVVGCQHNYLFIGIDPFTPLINQNIDISFLGHVLPYDSFRNCIVSDNNN